MLRFLRALGLYAKFALAALRSRLTGEPYLLNVHLSWNCNSKCRHCFIWKIDDHPDELSPEDYRRLFQRLGKAIAIVNFSGGQPTLKTGLDRIMLSAVEQLPNLALMHYTTNALTPEADLTLVDTVLSAHPRFALRVSISLDGLEDGHDSVRGVPGNFEKAARLFARLNERKQRFAGLRVGFSTTIGTFNVDRLPAISSAFPDKDFHTFDFYHRNDVYYGETPRDGMALDPEEVLYGVEQKGVDGILNGVFLGLNRDASNQPLCAAGDASISVYPKGEVKRCFYLDETIGDLRSSDFDLLEVVKRSRAKFGVDCRKCWNTCNAYSTMVARPLATASALWRARGGG